MSLAGFYLHAIHQQLQCYAMSGKFFFLPSARQLQLSISKINRYQPAPSSELPTPTTPIPMPHAMIEEEKMLLKYS